MATITIPKVRKETDVMMYVKLTDNGVTVDWTSLSEVVAFMYSNEQDCIAGQCETAIAAGDPSTLNVRYTTMAPQFLGVNSLLIRCTYDGMQKSFDVPVLEFVDRTAEATGQVTLDDPELPVSIEVTDVDTSLLDEAIAAALDAAAAAAAAAALVPLDVLTQCQEATIACQDATAHASPIIGENGNWKYYDPETGEYVDSELPSRGIQGPQGEQGPQGIQGNTGSSVEYPFELVNNRTTNDATKALSAAEGKRLGDDLSQLDQKVVKSEAQQLSITQRQTARKNIQVDDAIYGCRRNYTRNARTNNGNTLYLAGCNVTDLIPAKPGDVLVWRFGGTGSSNIRLEVFKADGTFIDGWSSNGYTDTRTVTVPAGETAYIRVAFSNSFANGEPVISPVSINGNDVILSAETDGYTDFVKSGNQEDELRWKPLPLGALLNCNTDSSGHLSPNPSYDSIRVTTKSAVTVPFPGCRIRARITDNLSYILGFYFWIGNSYGTFSQSIGWYFDKSEVVLPTSALTIRPVIAGRTTNATGWSVPITASDIQALIDNGDFAIEYYDDSSEGVVDRNEATRINLAALRRQLIVSPAADNGMDSMPVFSHITDIHGDALRWRNFLQYCDEVGVDFALETGDACLLQKRDSSEFIYDFANQHDTEILACIGNHEALPTGSTSLFDDNLAALATKYAYLASSGTPAAKCYYYKDYDAKKIRVIVLNQHEDGVYARRIGQAQVDWFIATLLSTPAGYGVVIAYHGPEDKVVADSPYDVFRQPAPNTGSSFEPNGSFVGDRPIEKLVDAFISRGSVDFTYDDHGATYDGDSDTTMQTVSVVADFSEVDASTEFICYVCGHRHEDWIGYYDHATNKQLCLCITTGNALYGDSSNPAWSNQSDLPRGGVGVSQDAFCVYAIDRINGNVKVMRVGATVTQKMVKREMMIIPYKD